MSIIGRRIAVCLLAVPALGSWSCSEDEGRRTTSVVTFRFHVDGADPSEADFLAKATTPTLIQKARAELSLPLAQRHMHISGPIEAGNGGNLQWSWHFVPDEWDLVELSAEVCDGTPRMVEDDLDNWLKTVGTYCPWSSRVVEEM